MSSSLSDRYEGFTTRSASLQTLVYGARRREDGLEVIIKTPASALLGERERLRLRQERRALERVQSARVPEVVELLEDPARALLVMRATAHRRVSAAMMRERTTLKRFLRFALGCAEALCDTHASGLLHRDVKPSNLLYDPQAGTTLLIDFGSACSLKEASRLEPEGTLAYMAPELFGRSEHAVDVRSDLYALGVTLYELLCGELPLQAGDELGWAHAHSGGLITPLQERLEGCPEALTELIHTLLNKTPSERLDSAASLVGRLKRLERSGLGRAPLSPPPQSSARLYGGRLESLPTSASTRTRQEGASLSNGIDLEAVLEANRAIASERDAQGLATALLNTLAELAGADLVALLTCETERALSWRVIATRDRGAQPAEALTLAMSQVRRCARRRESIALQEGAALSAALQDEERRALLQRGTRSVMAVPIVSAGELLGAIYLENRQMAGAFAPHISRMLTMIAAQAAISLQNINMVHHLEQLVEERTRELERHHGEIAVLFDHLPQAVLSIDETLRVEARYSRRTPEVLGCQQPAGESLKEALFQGAELSSEELSTMWAALAFSFGATQFMARLNWDHLPRRMTRCMPDGSRRELALDWSPICRDEDEIVRRVMLTVRDETALSELRARARANHRELEIVSQLLNAGLRDFKHFSYNARQRLNDNHMMCDPEELLDEGTLRAMFRNLHTIKGNARLLGLTILSGTAHECEEPVAALRQMTPQERSLEQRERYAEAIERDIHRFIAALRDHERILSEKFGELMVAHHAIDLHVVNRLREHADEALKRPELALNAVRAMHHLLTDAEAVSLSHLVEKTARVFPDLCKELKKPAPELVVLDEEESWLTFGFANALNDALMHLFRNAIDHGIEAPARRAAAGKPERGRITLRAESAQGGDLKLRIEDDGAGLDLEGLRRASDPVEISDEALAARIFEAGISTCCEVSELSGRGVGLDAVRAFLTQHGCEVAIELGAATGPGRRAMSLIVVIPVGELFKPSCAA